MSVDYAVFFRPKGVAIIGASRDPSKLGYGVVRNLTEHHYTGAIYPINNQATEILGHTAYASVQDVPDPVDLAIIVVPIQYVEEALLACAQRGIHYVTVVSGGFREVGAEGLAREERLKEIARDYDIAILGPNCIGTIDTHTPLNSTFVTGQPRPGEIGLVSQSGAVVAAIIDWARGSGVGFSRMVSLGNQAGVTEVDMLGVLASDPYTQVITAYIEGISDGHAFLQTAQSIAQRLPIIALKVGRSSAGAKAVSSHTGALAGAETAYDAVLRRAGVMRATHLEEMLDWARAFAWQPLPKGNRVAVLTNAGGAGIMAVDALESAGMQLAPLTDATRDYLRQRMPPAASIANPVDILAGSGPASYALALDALLADETVDAVTVITAPQDWFAPVSLAEVIGEVSNSALGRRKPVLAVIMGLASTSEAMQILHRRHIPNFAFPERIGSTFGAMWQRRQWLDAQKIHATIPIPLSRRTAEELLPAGWLSPTPIEQLLATYDIPQARSGIATNADEVVALAESIGFPIVLKLIAKDVVHKSDVGGLRLNLATAEAVRVSAQELLQNFEGKAEGLLVQQMIRGGVEVIIGMVRDPQFGALLMVGRGGTQVELLNDTTFELAPITRQQAESMLDATTLGKILAGYRGMPPADKNALIDILLGLSQLVLDYPEIAEIEINPVLVLEHGAFAVDTRVRVTQD